MKILRKQVEENPLYGRKALFDLYGKGSSGQMAEHVFKNALTYAWRESKDSRIALETFYSIAFSIGDISNRHHNLFGTAKPENGGEAHRKHFQWFLEWLKETDINQYYKFVESDLVRQFTNLDNVIGTRVQTVKGRTTITDEWNALDKVDISRIASYLARLIKKGSIVDHVTIAKFLSNVRLSDRQKRDRKTGEKVGSRPMQTRTKQLMKKRAELYAELSKIVNWEYAGTNFVGLRKWKAQFNDGLESKLFSTGRIKNLSQEEFLELLETAPSGARHRIRCRLLTADDKSKGKWPDSLSKWFLDWEKSKERAQQEQRELVEKMRHGVASEDDKKRLQEVKKEAKVNTGAESLFTMLDKFLKRNSSTDDLLMQAILDKIKFEVPVLVIKDVSGSMTGLPDRVASFLTTVTMLKNPSDDVDNMVVVFGSDAEVITDRSKGYQQQNRFMRGHETQIERLIDRTKDFRWNFGNISSATRNRGENTNFNSVAKQIQKWIDNGTNEQDRNDRREWLCKYPVFLVVSDGDMNNSHNAAQSVAEFQRTMKQVAGWEGVVVIWDVNTTSQNQTSKFEGLENVIHYLGWNLGIVNSIFTKIHDLDVIDVYTPLKSIWLMERYKPVRENVI